MATRAPTSTRTPKCSTLQEFNPDIEAFSAYIEHTIVYLAANDVPTENQVLVPILCYVA